MLNPRRLVGSLALSVVLALPLTVGAPPPAGPSSLPAAERIASTGTLLWRGTYDTGGLRQFQSTPWNNLPAAPTLVRAPVRSGSRAGAYRVPAGGSRSENVPRMRELRPGDNLWFAFSTRLGNDVNPWSPGWQVLAQWKNDGEGSPPLALVLRRGKYQIGGGYGWPGTNTPSRPKEAYRPLGWATRGAWSNWLMHIRFSSDPSVGYVEVWRNGTRVLTPWHPPGGTLYPRRNSYLKVGYYRSSAIRTSGTVYHDSWRVGTTRASVS